MSEATPCERDQLLGSQPPEFRTYPLTTDEYDTDASNPLAWIGGTSPIAAGVGFVGNGYDAKLVGDLPVWAQSAGAPVSIHAICKVTEIPTDWREVLASVTTSAVDYPKLELAAAVTGGNPHVQIRAHKSGSTVVVKWLNHINWRFEFRFPTRSGEPTPVPQALCWLDADRLLISGDVDNTKHTRMHLVDTSTGEYVGRCVSSTYKHINSLHVDPDGGVWGVCSVGGYDKRKRFDLAASFAAGELTENGDWNTGDVPTSSLAFATVGGVEYVLLSQYATSGTPRCYVFLRSQMVGPVNKADCVRFFRIGILVQDLVQRASDGLLYLSRNGQINSYDLAAILAGPDDVAPPAVATYSPATKMVEGIDFDPVTDRCWLSTEGMNAVGDFRSHCAVWSSDLSGAEENSYLVDFTGTEIQIRVNGRLMVDAWLHTPQQTPTKLAIGASPSSPAGVTGFLSGGIVRSVALKNGPFTQTELDALV